KNIVKIYRLGKKSDNITRPILIKFDDVKNKELVLRNSHRLKSIGDDLTGIGLSHDLTSEQWTELKQLVSSAKKQESEDKEGFLYRVRGDIGKWKVFEALAIRLKIGIDQFCLIALYRPGSEQTTSLIFEELIPMLEFITMSEAHVILMGDFNIHVEKRDSPFSLGLHEILDTFQLVNHVNQQTHVSGGTLDLVICSHDFPILDTKIDPCSVYSDHSYVGVRVALNQIRSKLVKACIKLLG
ncbi:hypothetical protein HELRODRAFT_184401, partial [Helobdella robusta]|uniref:Endonuclease/exonuclease/phosphatase domain-containing protein n=1 Tax=Helobdella robusta TaxID=6412 RepID=T1FL46_HELRO